MPRTDLAVRIRATTLREDPPLVAVEARGAGGTLLGLQLVESPLPRPGADTWCDGCARLLERGENALGRRGRVYCAGCVDDGTATAGEEA